MKIATGTVAAGKITGSFSFGNGAQWLADRRMLAANLRPTKRVEETLQRYYLRTTRQAGGFVIVPTWFLPNDRASIITESLTRYENRQFKWSPIKAFKNSKISATPGSCGNRGRLLHSVCLSLSFELLRTLPIGQMTSSFFSPPWSTSLSIPSFSPNTHLKQMGY